MKVTIPKEPEKAKTFELCEREDISMLEVVKQYEEYTVRAKNKLYAPHMLDKINSRIRWLEKRMAKEYLKKHG